MEQCSKYAQKTGSNNSMKQQWAIGWYALTSFSVLLIDRVTKHMVLMYLVKPYKVSRFISLELIFNRGISWGFFHSYSDAVFAAVSIGIALVTCVLAYYAYARWQTGHIILGEVMVVAGSISNLIDRAVYGGVVDFVHCAAYGWSWPVFNVADFCIVIGAAVMIASNLAE